MTWPDFDLFHKISLKMSPGWARARLDSSKSAAARTQSSTLTLCRTTPWRPSWIPFTKPTLLLWNFQVWNLLRTPLESAKKWWKGQIWRRSTQWSDSILGQRQNKQENGGRKFEDFEAGGATFLPFKQVKMDSTLDEGSSGEPTNSNLATRTDFSTFGGEAAKLRSLFLWKRKIP